MEHYNSQELYDKLFPDEKSKANAFDEIASHFFDRNFSVMQKSDIDLLMFKLYINNLYAVDESSDSAIINSDYEIAEALGITPSRVANYKEKKELRFPGEFDWKTGFLKDCEKADLEGDNINIYIHDIRVLNEIKKIIDEKGLFSYTTLTKKILSVKCTTFFDLILEALDGKEDEKKKLLKAIRNTKDINEQFKEDLEHEDFSFSMLKHKIPLSVKEVLIDAIKKLPVVGGGLSIILDPAFDSAIRLVNKKIVEHEKRQGNGG